MTKHAERQLVIKNAIMATSDKSGRTSAERVVAAAQDPANVLHDEFEWNDATAAHQHRLAVARALMREVDYTGFDVVGRPVTAVGYVRDPSMPASEQGYIPLSVAEKNKTIAREVLRQELARCEGAIKRAQKIAEVLKMRPWFDNLLVGVLEAQAEIDDN